MADEIVGLSVDLRSDYVPEKDHPRPPGAPVVQIGLQDGKIAVWHVPYLDVHGVARLLRTVAGKLSPLTENRRMPQDSATASPCNIIAG